LREFHFCRPEIMHPPGDHAIGPGW
jgi:hypothetical protein